MQIPDTCEEWKTVADGFYAKWNFPNCIGAIDGKLVRLQRPVRAGGSYFNYKRYFSVNMMAVVDSDGRFLYVTVGAQGSANDAAVYNASSFAELVADNSNPLNIPPTANLPDTNTATPMVFVADEAYPLRPYIMKPFSSRGLSPANEYSTTDCRGPGERLKTPLGCSQTDSEFSTKPYKCIQTKSTSLSWPVVFCTTC